MPVQIATTARLAVPILCTILSAAAAAQTAAGKDTIIRLRYVTIENRLRPDPESNIRVDRTIVARLSSGGSVTEDYSGKARNHSADFSLGGRLGADQNGGAGWNPLLGRVRWRVVDESTLVRVRELEQDIQTITVRVHGSTCEMTFTDELKPGFKEVKNLSLASRDVAYFTLSQLSETSCSIE